jgi:hypothetical protein
MGVDLVTFMNNTIANLKISGFKQQVISVTKQAKT